ncbi:MAG TPA: forkhead-associated protein [Spirochaetaceae bacterium]|nr:forkhead-associated protein [Spirochaetaceae bacterium]
MGYKRCPQEGHLMDSSWKYCPICIAPLAGWFVIMNDNGIAHRYFTLHEGKTIIGSGTDCEIHIPEYGLLRQQAAIIIQGNDCTVVDLSGDNSMKVNNSQVSRTTVMDGDIIEFNGVQFCVKLLKSEGRY